MLLNAIEGTDAHMNVINMIRAAVSMPTERLLIATAEFSGASGVGKAITS